MNKLTRRQFRCIRSPLGWNGGELFRRKGIYIIQDAEPDAIYYLTINGSIGRKYKISEIPKPFEKYFQEII